ncbi:molybdate ABC transporter substrate-binding protein [Janibacter cremeus]|uniref:Molybdate transport system substrate-binding protein n=1 Tax=Janibacter cremeus TaxID=1285192 RepID=A0A852VQ48_9MICO|nr:molybdate transport system substrate-binding protein [Janibacter cremeus]
MRHHRTAIAALTALTLSLTACSSSDEDEDGQTLRVGAAASLTNSFEQIAEIFEAENRGVTVELQFAGSSDLAAQINGGADFDVFASANEPNMDKVADSIAGEPTIFATNTLTIVTEPGNPEDITSLADLADPDLAVVICAPQVPCGTATQTLTDQQDVTLTPASEESQVTDVLAKVSSGEADAGLVYVTDATGAGDDVTTVPADGADAVVNRYPIAMLTGAESEEAQAFIDLVTGTQGQRVLGDDGFQSP